MAAGLELAPQLDEVVDLAVVGHPQPPVGSGHRLVAGGREVEDLQPPVAQRGRGPAGRGLALRLQAARAVRAERREAEVVGTAVREALGHRLHQRRRERAPTRREDAGDAAHGG